MTDIRLVDGADSTEGRLEVQINNSLVWGGVCDDQFGREDAIVACRMLGFK